MKCPQCKTGALVLIEIIERTRHIISLNEEETVYPMSSHEDITESYIGCDACDYMGSIQDVIKDILENNKPKEEPRYDAYIVRLNYNVDVFNVKEYWVLYGQLGKHHQLDLISTFEDQELAFAMMYRMSGIKGSKDKEYYPINE